MHIAMIWALLRRHACRWRAGQGVQQAVAGREVGCAGPDPLARDEFESRGGGRPGLDVQPHLDRWAQRPAGQADLDPAGAEVAITLDRPSQQAVAKAQFAVVSGELPACPARPCRCRTGYPRFAGTTASSSAGPVMVGLLCDSAALLLPSVAAACPASLGGGWFAERMRSGGPDGARPLRGHDHGSGERRGEPGGRSRRRSGSWLPGRRAGAVAAAGWPRPASGAGYLKCIGAIISIPNISDFRVRIIAHRNKVSFISKWQSNIHKKAIIFDVWIDWAIEGKPTRNRSKEPYRF